jgi:hypothetical protein
MGNTKSNISKTTLDRQNILSNSDSGDLNTPEYKVSSKSKLDQ